MLYSKCYYSIEHMFMKDIIQDPKNNVDLETFVGISTSLAWIEKMWDEKFKNIEEQIAVIKEIQEKQNAMDRQIWELTRNIGDLSDVVNNINKEVGGLKNAFTKDLNDFQKDLNQIGLSNFLKNHWWKLGGFVVALGTILGTVGEMLYRVHPK